MNAQHQHFFLLHGLGASGDDLAPVGRLLAEQAGIPAERVTIHAPDAPMAPVTLNNGYRMPSWFDIHGLDRSAPTDLAGIEAAAGRIALLINERAGDEPFWLVGFSQGGVVALRAACCTARVPAGVMLLSTWLPAPDTCTLPADRYDMPIFIGHGDADDVVASASAERMASHLRAAGATQVSQHRYAMAHSICPEELGDMAVWMNAVSVMG